MRIPLTILSSILILATAARSQTVAEQMMKRGLAILTDEVGVSGLRSSYHRAELESPECRKLPTFSEKRVRFGNGREPSPGGRIGRLFDEGVLATRIDGDDLIVAVACGSDANRWVRAGRFENAPHGQGDLFLDVQSGDEVKHYAALNAIDGDRPLRHRGFFDAARHFRHDGPAAIGELVLLESDDDIQTSGGRRGMSRNDSPRGLDERVFARGGRALGVGSVEHYDFVADQPMAGGQPARWYVSEWTVPLSVLGGMSFLGGIESGPIEIAFHIATTCGNDQIAGVMKIEPDEPELH